MDLRLTRPKSCLSRKSKLPGDHIYRRNLVLQAWALVLHRSHSADLFAAAIINVGLNDMLRFETTTNGVPNIQEFGSTKTEEGFRALNAMSALHYVKDGVKYPAVLLTTGINDPRVEPWMSGKMAARLQAATASGKPVLLRVDYDAGHGIGSSRKQRDEEHADELACLFHELGAPER
jgi:prolyl oligopeptidase